ncbi:hypothetical protein GQ44DRAFT_623957 [Phaeosphaeriaceae sp. PMI808]|nr:hypothetical protein GQ44DRAFT_623957 [Phaeosphaeriaceae sp. PMI808]
MSELHEALACLRPKEFSDVPIDQLNTFLPEILANAELIANSIPPIPNGMPYESSKRTRTSLLPAINAADLTISEARRPPPAKAHEALQKAWGKPLKLGAKETATGMSVFKMAGHDRHGAWFARTGVHEGLGFAKWKQAMLREFPESLEVQGGPGEGNVRGIGGDRRLEDITVDGVGKLEVYQLSAQFPGPTSPREFITLLITSDNCLTDASKVGSVIPRHFMVVSIPVSHPDAPPRNGMVRGFYESIELIREIPLPVSTEAGVDDAETNPVEWVMVTRSDPGGGIPRFMVERNVPSSIVQDAIKFLDWACAKTDIPEVAITGEDGMLNVDPAHDADRRLSMIETNGITAGVGTSIADRPSGSIRRLSHRIDNNENSGSSEGLVGQLKDSVGAYIPDALNPLQRTISSSSSSTASSVDSFASAEMFTSAADGLSIDDSIATPSTLSQQEHPILDDSPHAREMQKIEDKKKQLKEKLEQARERQTKELSEESNKTQKQIERASEKHTKERKKHEEKFEREIRKLEERREKETKKLLLRQQKEADKNHLLKAQRESDEHKQRGNILEEENKLLKQQIGELQRENTALVARLGKSDMGRDILKLVRGEDSKGRSRASSRASKSSEKSAKRGSIVRSNTSHC